MTSQKQARANRRNSLHSRGPKTEEGKQRSAVNATKHGLSVPVEASDWGPQLVSLADLLQRGEGLSDHAARELARRIIEYERNVQFQRERFLLLQVGKDPDVDLSASEKPLALSKLINEALASGGIDKSDEDFDLYKGLGSFFRTVGRREIRKEQRAVRTKHESADRYLRRAANQLIKQCRSLSTPLT